MGDVQGMRAPQAPGAVGGSPSVAGQDLVARAIPPPQPGAGQPAGSQRQPQPQEWGASLGTERDVIPGCGVPTALPGTLCPQSVGGCWSWAPAAQLPRRGILPDPWHLCPVLHLTACSSMISLERVRQRTSGMVRGVEYPV